MHSSKSIGIVGFDTDDLIHYWSRIYKCADKRCCIVDCSVEQSIQYTLPEPEQRDYTYRDIDIRTNRPPTPLSVEEQDNYDIIFYIIGVNAEGIQLFIQSDLKVICTDFHRKHIMKIKAYLECLSKALLDREENINVTKIYRQVLPGKIKPKYINHLLTYSNITYNTSYELDYSEDMTSLNIHNQYNSIIKFNKITTEYKTTLKELALTVEDIEPKAFKKVYKQAERGK